MESHFTCKAILYLISFEGLDTLGQFNFLTFGPTVILSCIKSMSLRRPSSLSSVKTKKGRDTGNDFSYFFEATYFARGCSV